MKLKDWRKKKRLSQAALAKELGQFARDNFPSMERNITQTAVGYWERGTMPRKHWLYIIEKYTRNQVKSDDFVKSCVE